MSKVTFDSIDKLCEYVSKGWISPNNKRKVLCAFKDIRSIHGYTRADLQLITGLPINALTKAVNDLVNEGAILDTNEYRVNRETHRKSKVIKLNNEYTGTY